MVNLVGVTVLEITASLVSEIDSPASSPSLEKNIVGVKMSLIMNELREIKPTLTPKIASAMPIGREIPPRTRRSAERPPIRELVADPIADPAESLSESVVFLKPTASFDKPACAKVLTGEKLNFAMVDS